MFITTLPQILLSWQLLVKLTKQFNVLNFTNIDRKEIDMEEFLKKDLKKRFVIILSGLTISFTTILNAHGEDEKQIHTIDNRLQEHLDSSGGSDSIMAGSYYEAAGSWEKEMNKYYRLIMKNLKPPQQNKLKIAQDKWKEYCRSELDFTSKIIGLEQDSFGGGHTADYFLQNVKKESINKEHTK